SPTHRNLHSFPTRRSSDLKTDYAALLKTGLERINEAHTKRPFDFCMLNGDIVHNDPQFYPAVKKDLEQLQPKYYVTVGNHDRVSPAEWEQIWAQPVNYDFKVKDTVFLAATTSDEK